MNSVVVSEPESTNHTMNNLNARFQALANRRVSLAKIGVKLSQSPWLATGETQELGEFAELIKLPMIASCGIELNLRGVQAAVLPSRIIGWAPTLAMVSITHAWFNTMPNFRKMDEERQNSYVIGAMTNFAEITNEDLTPDKILAARKTIITGLKSKAPTRTAMQSVFRSMKNVITTGGFNRRVLHQHGLYYFPWSLWNPGSPLLKEFISRVALHPDPDTTIEIPAELLEALDTAEIWTSQDPDVLLREWKGMTIEQIAVFYHHEAMNSGLASRWIAIALFVSSATISKNAFSDNWVTSRVERLEREIPGVQDNSVITAALLTTYSQLYPKERQAPHLIYNAIAYNYTVAATSGLSSIKWILEQARASNVSALTGLAETMTTHKTLSATILMSHFGENQVRSAALLALRLIINPWISITSPPISMSQYPDLAYLGLRLGFLSANKGRGRRAQYGGNPDANSTKGKVFLDSFADSIVELSGKSGQTALSIENIALMYGYKATPEGLDSWVMTKTQVTGSLESGPSTPTTTTVTSSTFEAWMTGTLINNVDKAFQLVMSALRVSAGQQTYAEFACSNDQYEVAHINTTPLSDQLKRAAETLGITLTDDERSNTPIALTKIIEGEHAYKIATSYIYELVSQPDIHNDDNPGQNDAPPPPRNQPDNQEPRQQDPPVDNPPPRQPHPLDEPEDAGDEDLVFDDAAM
uniref:Uncharacterized protein n=1 Tax=Mogami virus TaxID=2170597 RepID=A0A2S0S4N8_9VIRU|nr:hypothetical protein [Mogami virus]